MEYGLQFQIRQGEKSMKRKWTALAICIALVGLTGCSSEPRPGGSSSEPRKVALHEPGVYKGAKDQMPAQQQQQALIDRFRLVQTDR
jgi:hypothetical protein